MTTTDRYSAMGAPETLQFRGIIASDLHPGSVLVWARRT
jgi:hypothetical protein